MMNLIENTMQNYIDKQKVKEMIYLDYVNR